VSITGITASLKQAGMQSWLP